MSENQERRRAQRQQRGLLRVEHILHTAGMLFAEVGYDKTTTNMIAERANISPGSLYQFFSNKEAIAQAYMSNAVARLHRVYDTLLAPESMGLPFAVFNDVLVDTLLAFNKENPGYLALSLASTLSVSLAGALADVQTQVSERLEAVFAARWPHHAPEQRRLMVLVSYRVFIALLPLALAGEESYRETIVRELKKVLYRYLASMPEASEIRDKS